MHITALAVFSGRFRVFYAITVALLVVTFAASGQDATLPLSTLYNFPGSPGGAYPEGGLVLGTNNALFGTTFSGGSGWGTVFELSPPAMPGGLWTETTIYTFTGSGGDGASPQGSLVIGPSNIIYGTTANGGTNGLGTVYQLVPPTSSGGSWTETVLYSFKGGTTDGQNPMAGLVLNSAANLYGTTPYGGSGNCGGGCGTVFQLKPNGGSGWNENVVYNFQGGCVTPQGGPTCTTDGAQPQNELLVSKSGVMYGVTYAGGSTTATGSAGFGTVFQLVAGQPWKETVIYAFTGLTDGGNPDSRLTSGPGAALFGSTFWAGSTKNCKLGGFVAGCGTAFSLTPPASSGSPWTYAVLYTFTGAGTDGAHPFGGMAYAGALYGTTYAGGSTVDTCFPSSYPGCGTIFQLKPPATTGGKWTKVILHDFNNSDGGGPNGVIHTTTGAIYGSTYIGGITPSVGTIFEIQ